MDEFCPEFATEERQPRGEETGTYFRSEKQGSCGMYCCPFAPLRCPYVRGPQAGKRPNAVTRSDEGAAPFGVP